MKTILISGGKGKLAQALIEEGKNKFTFIAPSHKDMDITSKYNISKYFLGINKPDYFIHAAAITRPIIIHEEKIAESINTNIVGTCNIVNVCHTYNIKLIYISTDYVYQGIIGDYKEEDPVLPFTNYGWSKLGGECAVQMYKNSLIIRLALCNYPFSHEYAYTNMIKNYIYEKEAAAIILRLLDQFGTINVGGDVQSVYDFAKTAKPKESTTKNLNTSMNLGKLNNV